MWLQPKRSSKPLWKEWALEHLMNRYWWWICCRPGLQNNMFSNPQILVFWTGSFKNIFIHPETFTKPSWRFHEWGSASWEFQKAKLLDEPTEGQTWDVRHLSLYHTDDGQWLQACQDVMTGRAMSQWWDITPEAGSRSRPQTNFQEEPPVLDILTVSSDEHKVQILVHELEDVLVCFSQVLTKA